MTIIDRSALASSLVQPTIVYAKSDASGANNGTSWDDAYTSLSTAIAALPSSNATLYTDTPPTTPFRGSFPVASKSNVNIITNEGPNHETRITDGRVSSDWSESSGVWSIPLGSKPKYVAWNYGPDSITGSSSGIDLTEARAQAVCEKSVFAIGDCQVWYGFLVENTGTPTTPGEGEWGHSSGTLYVNPPGTPSESEVDAGVEYCPGVVNGLDLQSCSNCSVSGRLVAYLYPDSTSNAGYGAKLQGCTDCSIADVLTYGCGYHAVGSAGSAGAGNSMRRCLSASIQTASPFVFYSDDNVPVADYVGEDLLVNVAPLLDWRGRALTVTAYHVTAYYSHSTGGNTVGGVEWRRCMMISQEDRLFRADGVTPLTVITSTARGKFASAANAPAISNKLDFDQYPIKAVDCYSEGFSSNPTYPLAYDSCHISRRGTSTTLSGLVHFATGGVTVPLYIRNSILETGDYASRYFQAVDAGDMLVLDGCLIKIQTTTADTGLIGIIRDDVADKVVHLLSNRIIRSEGGELRGIMRGANPTIHSNGYVSVLSDGKNRMEVSGSGFSSTTHDQAWWQSNIDGGSTDVWEDPSEPWTSGSGSPDFVAPAGSLYTDTGGGEGTTLYVNTDGTDTGWSPVHVSADVVATFDTGTSEADPGTAEFAYDNATPGSITKLYINQEDGNGYEIVGILDRLQPGNLIKVQQVSDPSVGQIFAVTATATDNTGWYTIPVSQLNGGTLPSGVCSISVVATTPTDVAKAYTALQHYTKEAFAFTATPTFDCTPGTNSPVRGTTVLTADVTALNYSNVPSHPGFHEWHVKQDGGGTNTITKHSSVFDPDDLLSTLDTTGDMNSVIVADFVDGHAIITRVQALGVLT